MNTEYFIVMRNNTDPDLPKEVIERYYPHQGRTAEETKERAEKRQGWLKFREGWQDVRLYEGVQMKLVRDGRTIGCWP